MKLIFQIVICGVLLIGCKNDTKKEINKEEKTPQPEKTTDNKNIFSVKLNVQLQKDDALEVFYLENESDTYAATQMIQKRITGMDSFQEINFELPTNVYPANIRLDFGFNKNQDPIKISDCTITYNNNSFVIKGKELKNYFRINGGMEMQSDSLTFNLKPFDLNGKEVHDPYMVGNKNLQEALMTKI